MEKKGNGSNISNSRINIDCRNKPYNHIFSLRNESGVKILTTEIERGNLENAIDKTILINNMKTT